MDVAVTEAPFEAAVRSQGEQDTPDTILVVDDSPIDARLAASIVRKHLGLRVIFAGDGVQALEAIHLERPVAVLTDLLMPNMDGLELVHEVCKRYPQIPVILMTAAGSEQVASEALQSGAASYVPKLVLHEQLPAVLRQVLSAGRAERRRRRFLQGLTGIECRFTLESDDSLAPVF